MKNIRKIVLLLTFAATFAACEKEDDQSLTALSVEGIKAEALPGAIHLSWNAVENRDFLYTTVSYYDYATQTTKTTLCSRYTTSLDVENLLNRYGKYKFVFTAYDKNRTPGQPIYIERQCQKAESYYQIASETEIPLTVEQLSTNAQEPSEGPIANLIDGNNGTFFQSFWDEWGFPDLKPAGYHYLTFDLRQELTTFRIQYWNRMANGSLPTTVNLYTSTDGVAWSLLTQLDNLPSDNGSSYSSELLIADAPFSHLKFEVIKCTDIYQNYFSLAEIKFYDVDRVLVDPEAE